MGYAVLHIQKGSSSGGGLGNHIDRISGFEHSFENADPKLKHLNVNYELNNYCKIKFTDAISKRISDGYKSNRKIRTDAIKYCNAILTGSNEEMIELKKNPEEFKKWFFKNVEFAKSEWGAENIIRFTLHLDELTPHIHCSFVPITNDGRLSAKEIFGNPKDLTALQDRYGIAMEPFDLKRGLRGSKAKHETTQEYYGRIQRENNVSIDYSKDEKIIIESVLKPSKLNFLNIDKFHTGNEERLKKEVKRVLTEQQKRYNILENENRKLKKELGTVRGHLNQINRNFGDVNQAQFSLKIEKNEIICKSEGAAVRIDKNQITEQLQSQKFNKAIQPLTSQILRDVTNAKYQNILRNYNLLEISPKKLGDLAIQATKNVLNHSDTVSYKIAGKLTEVTFYFVKEEDSLILKMEYKDYKGQDQKLSKEVDTLENIFNNINKSLGKQQLELIKANSPGRKRGPSI